MRRVTASLNVPSILKCRYCSLNTSLNVVYFISPSSLTRYIQWRTAYLISFSRKILDSFPYLLNLTNAEFRLIEKHKVLIKVTVSIQYKAFCLHLWITSCTASLLHVVLQRVADIIVYNQSHIFLVNAHTECRSGNNHLCFTTHKSILVLHLLGSLHFSIEWQSSNAVVDQVLCQLASSSGS